MAEFETGGHTYRTDKMNAREQLHLLRGLGPLFGPMVQLAVAPGDINDPTRQYMFMAAFFEAFAKMTETEVDTLVNKCLAVAHRREGGNGQAIWGPALFSAMAGREQYNDIELASLMTICWQVIQENLGGFFAIGSGPSLTSGIGAPSPSGPFQMSPS